MQTPVLTQFCDDNCRNNTSRVQTPTYNNWHRVRTQFSHDWLRNGLAILLGRVTNVLGGVVSDPDVMPELQSFLAQWPKVRDEAFELTATACDVLSPRQYLSTGFLATLADEDREYLGELIDARWKRIQKPGEVIRRSIDALNELDALIGQLVAFLETSQAVNEESQEQFQTLVKDTRIWVAKLSAVMTELGQCRYF